MEISGISSSLPYTFVMPEKDGSASSPAAMQDTIDVHSPELLDDNEVDSVLDDTMRMITGDPAAALGVHGGLSQGRIFALVGM